jgi:hypothetical protein
MTTSTAVGNSALAFFGDGGTDMERALLRFIATAAWEEHERDRGVDAVQLAARAINLGQGISTGVRFPDMVSRLVDGCLREAALAALKSAFRDAGLS